MLLQGLEVLKQACIGFVGASQIDSHALEGRSGHFFNQRVELVDVSTRPQLGRGRSRDGHRVRNSTIEYIEHERRQPRFKLDGGRIRAEGRLHLLKSAANALGVFLRFADSRALRLQLLIPLATKVDASRGDTERQDQERFRKRR